MTHYTDQTLNIDPIEIADLDISLPTDESIQIAPKTASLFKLKLQSDKQADNPLTERSAVRRYPPIHWSSSPDHSLITRMIKAIHNL